MKDHLLRDWLNLKTDVWPPDFYTLLGLKPGSGSSEEIEILVLERMDKLRHHQLKHPDQVTEGMNRLAQALNCLTDPVSRKEYDAKIGLKVVETPAPPKSKVPAKPSPSPTIKPAPIKPPELIPEPPSGILPKVSTKRVVEKALKSPPTKGNDDTILPDELHIVSLVDGSLLIPPVQGKANTQFDEDEEDAIPEAIIRKPAKPKKSDDIPDAVIVRKGIPPRQIPNDPKADKNRKKKR